MAYSVRKKKKDVETLSPLQKQQALLAKIEKTLEEETLSQALGRPLPWSKTPILPIEEITHHVKENITKILEILSKDPDITRQNLQWIFPKISQTAWGGFFQETMLNSKYNRYCIFSPPAGWDIRIIGEGEGEEGDSEGFKIFVRKESLIKAEIPNNNHINRAGYLQKQGNFTPPKTVTSTLKVSRRLAERVLLPAFYKEKSPRYREHRSLQDFIEQIEPLIEIRIPTINEICNLVQTDHYWGRKIHTALFEKRFPIFAEIMKSQQKSYSSPNNYIWTLKDPDPKAKEARGSYKKTYSQENHYKDLKEETQTLLVNQQEEMELLDLCNDPEMQRVISFFLFLMQKFPATF